MSCLPVFTPPLTLRKTWHHAKHDMAKTEDFPAVGPVHHDADDEPEVTKPKLNEPNEPCYPETTFALPPASNLTLPPNTKSLAISSNVVSFEALTISGVLFHVGDIVKDKKTGQEAGIAAFLGYRETNRVKVILSQGVDKTIREALAGNLTLVTGLSDDDKKSKQALLFAGSKDKLLKKLKGIHERKPKVLKATAAGVTTPSLLGKRKIKATEHYSPPSSSPAKKVKKDSQAHSKKSTPTRRKRKQILEMESEESTSSEDDVPAVPIAKKAKKKHHVATPEMHPMPATIASPPAAVVSLPPNVLFAPQQQAPASFWLQPQPWQPPQFPPHNPFGGPLGRSPQYVLAPPTLPAQQPNPYYGYGFGGYNYY